ncbi:multidrug effflux MFS transporter [Pararhodobacter zhoushanensis]|uniref:Multidrug effflux MFS transporter n=1 Tax=Pararhodobacter zhoushanensis TaxID=2479545 RepID=A0ABT3H0F4_9RHOB|nr:multidrug effflux MFS transporter [Pararhodobacter zhoushanensis]MCW1933293.1 multidrug effflux MFS transporter [Pararhodobacter zhoushanensis]
MTPPTKTLPFPEFIGLLALLMATVAYSVDAMLPLLTPISEELAQGSMAQAQQVITVFMIGLGTGTFIMGPLSDRLGRKTVILCGIVLYMIAAAIAATSQDITMLLVARFLQGFGAAAPRVVSQALVRDLYSGRMMARVVSFSMTVFTLVPAIAPFMGAELGALFGWRAIFWSFMAFGTVSGLWLLLRQPETLSAENRRPLAIAPLWLALKTVLGHSLVRLYLLALTFVFTTMLCWISGVAAIFEQSFDRTAQFPAWFAFVAILSAPASLINARLVVKVGMRRMVAIALTWQIAISVIALIGFQYPLGDWGFELFILFMLMQFFSIGFLIGNLNALVLEPMGHVAGMAASVVGGFSTVISALLAATAATFMNGTPVPLAVSSLLCLVLASACMIWARQLRAD